MHVAITRAMQLPVCGARRVKAECTGEQWTTHTLYLHTRVYCMYITHQWIHTKHYVHTCTHTHTHTHTHAQCLQQSKVITQDHTNDSDSQRAEFTYYIMYNILVCMQFTFMY